MNVKFCDAVKSPGDWAFFKQDDRTYLKAILPIAPVEVPYETAGDVRMICLPVSHGGWTWTGGEETPTLAPSIKTEIVIGHTSDTPPKPIMKEIYHGHLQGGQWVPA